MSAQLAKMASLLDNSAVNRTLRRIHKRDQQSADLAYWLSKPMAERIAAVEELRLQAFGGVADAQSRLPRICRVAQRKRR